VQQIKPANCLAFEGHGSKAEGHRRHLPTMLGRVIDVSAIVGVIRSEVQRSRWRSAQTWPI